MKILTTSDWHADAVTAGVSRYQEAKRSVMQMVKAAIDENVDVFVFAGDLSNPGRQARTIDSISLAVWASAQLTANKIHNIWIAGNHDVVDTDSYSSTVKPIGMMSSHYIRVFDSPGVTRIGNRSFLALPYVPKSLGHLYADPKSTIDLDGEMEKHNWKETIVVSHMTAIDLEGLELGTESTDLAYGKSYKLPLSELRARGVPLVIQGHFHKHQIIGNLFIPGAIARFGFGEMKHAPKYHIIEI